MERLSAPPPPPLQVRCCMRSYRMERSAGSLCSVCLLTLFLLAHLIYGCHSKYTIHVFFSTQGAAESHFPLVYDIATPVSHQAGLYAFYRKAAAAYHPTEKPNSCTKCGHSCHPNSGNMSLENIQLLDFYCIIILFMCFICSHRLLGPLLVY